MYLASPTASPVPVSLYQPHSQRRVISLLSGLCNLQTLRTKDRWPGYGRLGESVSFLKMPEHACPGVQHPLSARSRSRDSPGRPLSTLPCKRDTHTCGEHFAGDSKGAGREGKGASELDGAGRAAAGPCGSGEGLPWDSEAC